MKVATLILKCLYIAISSVQFSHSVVSDSLRPHESQHSRPPCPITNRKCFKTIPFILAKKWSNSKIKKKKDVQDFRTHNYKTLLKKKETKLNEVIHHAYLLENSYCWFNNTPFNICSRTSYYCKKEKWPVNFKLYKEYQKAMNIEENL